MKDLKKAMDVFSKLMMTADKAIQNLAPAFAELAENLKSFEKFNKHLNEAHAKDKLNLPPFLDEIPLTEFAKLFRDPTKSAISVYDEYFNSHLEELKASWKRHPLFEERITILSHALDAHKTGMHTLSIPVFLTQFEGILRQLLGHKGSGDFKSQLSKVVAAEKVNDISDISIITEAIMNEMFKSTIKQEPSIYPNRNLILHGVQIDYYKAQYASIRCILALDYLRLKDFDLQNLYSKED